MNYIELGPAMKNYNETMGITHIFIELHELHRNFHSNYELLSAQTMFLSYCLVLITHRSFIHNHLFRIVLKKNIEMDFWKNIETKFDVPNHIKNIFL